MKISYAQRLEDYHLAQAFAGRETGTYVDVGAGDPVFDNVSYWFYLQGWSGLVIEPQEELLAAYAALRPRDRRDGSLVGRAEGEAPFYRFSALHGLSTMKAEAAEAARLHEADFFTERRPVATLAKLMERHAIGRIDFLKIDVEGAEHDALAGADWNRWRPSIVLAEAVSPGASQESWRDWDALLAAQDYEFHLFDGLNRYYVAREEEGLKERLPREPAPWDVVAHHEWWP